MQVSEELEKRIRALEALEAIRKVKYKYFRCLDQGRWDELADDCFAVNAEVDFGDLGVFHGREALRTFYKDKIGPAFTMCVHQGHNPEIELTSEVTAHGLWQLEAFAVMAGTNRGYWIAGCYDEEYAVEDERWKISKVKLSLGFWSDIEKGWAEERFSPMPEA